MSAAAAAQQGEKGRRAPPEASSCCCTQLHLLGCCIQLSGLLRRLLRCPHDAPVGHLGERR